MSEIELYGAKLPGGGPKGFVGSIGDGPPLTNSRLAAALQRWPRIKWIELDQRDGYFVDLGSGSLFRRVPGDALLADAATSRVTLFAVSDAEELVYLERAEGTVADLDAAAEATARQQQQAAEDRVAFLARQPLRPVLLEHATGVNFPTLKAAARAIEEAVGRIAVGPYDEILVELPAQLRPPQPFASEIDERRSLAACAQTSDHPGMSCV